MPAYNEVNGIPVHASEYLLVIFCERNLVSKGMYLLIMAQYGCYRISQNNFK